MRRLIVAALAPSLATIFLVGTAQAMDSLKPGLNSSADAAKSGGGLLIAQAGGPAPKSPGEKKSSDEEKKSSGEKKPAAKKQVGNAKNNTLNGTKGPDLMLGGTGNDGFGFNYFPGIPELNTLDDGERIADYEFGERIVIRGVRLPNNDVKLVYDAKKKETRIEIDLPPKNDKGETDGRVRRTVILTGDKRGTLNVDIPCCISKATEIWIYNEKAAKAARAARIKVTKEAKEKAKKKAAKKEPVKRRSAAARWLVDPTKAPADVSEEYVRNFFGLALLANLFSPPPAATEERQLREVAARYSEAQVALSEGPGASGLAKARFGSARARLEVLAEPRFTRSPRVRRLARTYLSRLPKRFVSGHAYTRDDGTAAADPDPRIRFTLKRGRYSKDAGDGADGGDD